MLFFCGACDTRRMLVPDTCCFFVVLVTLVDNLGTQKERITKYVQVSRAPTKKQQVSGTSIRRVSQAPTKIQQVSGSRAPRRPCKPHKYRGRTATPGNRAPKTPPGKKRERLRRLRVQGVPVLHRSSGPPTCGGGPRAPAGRSAFAFFSWPSVEAVAHTPRVRRKRRSLGRLD